ncbi:MAG: CCA tRNA nucleotidyltransferase [Planctomycetota bacterium]
MKSPGENQREFAIEVVQRLRDAGYRGLWAGGCVRDQLLGRAPKDYDVATNAMPGQVRELFGAPRTLRLGEAFGVIAVLGGRALEPIEVATFRSDGDYADGRRPSSVTYTDAEQDAKRRDFTINGLFYDPVEDQIIDYVGGQRDLEAGVIRAIGNPDQRIEEDKLRMLRAIRFAATLGFAIDPATLAALQRRADQATVVSAERTGAELRRILEHANRSRGLQLMWEAGLLQRLLPEVADRAAGDEAAWRRRLGWLDCHESLPLQAALAILLHEVATGEKSVAICRRLRFPNVIGRRTAWLISRLPEALRCETLPWPRLQRLMTHESGQELYQCVSAMLPASSAGLRRWRELDALPDEVRNPTPLATGDDLIAQGFEPGPSFAVLLEHLRDQQLEKQIMTRDEALAEAARWLGANRRSKGR